MVRNPPDPSPNVTALLARVTSGDELATGELFPLVYDELRGLAAHHLSGERAGHTLQPTALVNEAYLRLIGPGDVTWENRAHFFGAAAKAIRRILMDHARARGRQKRGGGQSRLSLDDAEPVIDMQALDLLALDESLERLAKADAAKARVVELRYFAGLSLEDTARVMDISPATVSRHWEFARAWLHRDLSQGPTA